jgi:hypothetical protein
MLPQAKRRLRRFQIYLGAKFRKKSGQLSSQFAASANRRFKFQKRSQLFIRVHNETLSVITMRISQNEWSRETSGPIFLASEAILRSL